MRESSISDSLGGCSWGACFVPFGAEESSAQLWDSKHQAVQNSWHWLLFEELVLCPNKNTTIQRRPHHPNRDSLSREVLSKPLGRPTRPGWDGPLWRLIFGLGEDNSPTIILLVINLFRNSFLDLIIIIILFLKFFMFKCSTHISNKYLLLKNFT